MKFIDRILARYNLSLVSLVTLGFLLVFLTGFIGYFILIDRQARENFELAQAKALEGVNDAITKQVYRSLQREVAGVQSRAEILAKTQVYRQNPELKQSWIDASASYLDDVSWMGFANTKGIVEFAEKGRLKGVDVSQRPWYQQALEKPLFFGDVHAAILLAKFFESSGDADQIRFIDIAVPIKDSNDEIVGVLGSHFHWTTVGKKLKLFAKEFEMHPEMGFAIFGRDGVRLAEASVAEALKTPELQAAFSTGHGIATVNINGRPHLVSYSKLPGDYLDWVIVNYEPIGPGALYDDIAKTIKTAGLVALIMSLLVAFALYLWMRKMVFQSMSGASVGTGSKDTWLPSEFKGQAEQIDELRSKVLLQNDLLTQATAVLDQSFSGFSEKFPGYLLRVSAPFDDAMKFNVEYVTPSVRRFLGVSAEAFKADMGAAHKYFSSVELEAVHQAFSESTKTMEPFVVSFRTCHPDGHFWMQISAAVRIEGEKFMWDCLVLDITALKEAEEEATQASEGKSVFLATLSHEIRTPLNAILGYAQLMEEDQTLSGEVKQQVSVIRHASEPLATILGDILDASSLDVNKLKLNQVAFNLNELIDTLCAIYKPMAAAKQLNCVLDVTPAMPMVQGDPVRLRQIISNLLSNAIKYSDKGQVALSCEALEMGDRLKVKICVRDTGIGISPQDQKSLFSTFYQVQDKDGVRRAGSGLGLFIARSLAEKMGGSLSLASEVGHGSQFTLMLDLPLSTESGAGVQKALADARPLKVLVVDDAAMNRTILKTYLTRHGHQVTEAADGAEAVTMALADTPDVIFMDVEMPGMDGITATRKIRESGLSANQVCIIAMTGQAFDLDVAAGKAAGMNDYLTKPVNFKQVAESLRHHCG